MLNFFLDELLKLSAYNVDAKIKEVIDNNAKRAEQEAAEEAAEKATKVEQVAAKSTDAAKDVAKKFPWKHTITAGVVGAGLGAGTYHLLSRKKSNQESRSPSR